MEFTAPVGDTAIDQRTDGVVGKPLDRVDGALKVTGRATYAAEYAGFGEVVYGYPVPATIARGRIADIDTSEAERQPGVLTVLTWRNVDPPNGQAPRTPDGPTTGRTAVPCSRGHRSRASAFSRCAVDSSGAAPTNRSGIEKRRSPGLT